MTRFYRKYKFTEGDKVTNLFSDIAIDGFRERYKNACYGVATLISKRLSNFDYLCSYVTFTCRNAISQGGITVWSELLNSNRIYEYHTVVLLGDCVMDILHSDRLISTSEYVRNLRDTNIGLEIDYDMSGHWVSGDGFKRQLSIDDLISGQCYRSFPVIDFGRGVRDYKYSDGDTITQLLPQGLVNNIRKKYSGNGHVLASSVAKEIRGMGVCCGVVTFANGNAFRDGGVAVRDEFNGVIATPSFHSVALLGKCIYDVSFSDRLFEISEYTSRLAVSNARLSIEYPMTSCWHDNQGRQTQVTVEKLLRGDWGIEPVVDLSKLFHGGCW